ncbi:MAG: lytic murein transglycosylase [Gammaproteobacteria bacterium]
MSLFSISRRHFSVILVTMLWLMIMTIGTAFAAEDFQQWLLDLRREAAARGISTATLDNALRGIQPLPRVIELDQRQPEFTETFWNYLDKRITASRIQQGQRLLLRHRALLADVERRYGIPPRYLVAFWGLETNYGSYLGSFPTVPALLTLAYDPRRSDFFRSEALDALRIIDQGHVTAATMKGSWAGAIGQLQFLPSTFLRHAVDGDGDGKKDVWHDVQDVFASGAHYLQQMGWKHGERWGREVRLPPRFDWNLAGIDIKKPLTDWARLGVRRVDGAPLPATDMSGTIVLPQGHAGPAFLVYDNFEVILKWNRSINYAIAVGHLADRLVGLPPLRNGRRADNHRLTRELALELQQRLNALGFDSGTADGIPGSRTRAAVRAYQQTAGLPADGYPSLPLLEHLRRHEDAE